MLDPADPRQYLQTEARIIAENDTRVAIVVSADKAWIARNLMFLAALSELMPAPDPAPAKISKP